MIAKPQISVVEPVVQADPKIHSPWQIFWQRLRHQRIATLGGIILVILYLMALFAGFIAPYGYERQDRDRFFHRSMALRIQNWHLAVQGYEPAPGTSKYQPIKDDAAPIRFFVKGEKYNLFGFIPTTLHLFGPSDEKHPVCLLGTDQYGRDIFSRLLYGSQISLSIGLIGIVIRFSLGMVMGGISGYFGGMTDSVIMRFCELIMSIPALYLIMSLRATFPANLSSTRTYLLIIAILSFIGWASTARVIRGMALSLREGPFVLAPRTLGQTNWGIVLRHILPSSFSYGIVAATLSVPYYILGEVV